MRPGVSREGWLTALLACTLAALLYVNSIPNGFALDDNWVIVNNPILEDLGDWRTLLGSDYWAPRTQSGLYRPVATLSYALNRALGEGAASFHATHVLLHAANSALVALLFLQLGAGRLAAGLGALLFAAHAVHTEAVAAIAGGRPELLAAFFSLLALWLHVARDRRQQPAAHAPLSYALELLAYGLALGAKESAITLPAVLVAYDLLLSRRKPTASRMLRWASRYAGHALVTLAYLGARTTVLAGVPLPPVPEQDNPLGTLGFPYQQWSALYVAVRYLWLLLYPRHLAYNYGYAQIPPLESFLEPRSLWVLAFLIGGAALLIAARRFPLLLFALLWALISFSVTSNLLIPIGTILGERLLYMPSVGFCLAVGAAVGAAHRPGRRWLVAGLTLAIAAHGARSVRRNLDWRSEETLYLHDVAVSPNSVKVQLNAGFAHSRRGEVPEAIAAYRASLRIQPNAGAYNNLGYLLIDRDIDVDEGVALLQKAVAMAGPQAEYLDSLAWGYFKQGRLEEARELLRQSLRQVPYGPTAEGRRAHLREVEAALARRRAAPDAGVRPDQGSPSH